MTDTPNDFPVPLIGRVVGDGEIPGLEGCARDHVLSRGCEQGN